MGVCDRVGQVFNSYKKCLSSPPKYTFTHSPLFFYLVFFALENLLAGSVLLGTTREVPIVL